MKSKGTLAGIDPIDPIAEKIEILFNEVGLAVKWQRPSILFAVYRSEDVRTEAEAELEQKLNEIGQKIYTIHAQDEQNFDLIASISSIPDLANTVLFIDGLKWDCTSSGSKVINEINKQREYFLDNSLRTIFWLLDDEVTNFATHATECWILRHRVVDFSDSQPSGVVAVNVQRQPSDEAKALSVTDDFPLPPFLNKLPDLSEDPDLDLQYARNMLSLGVLCWRRGNAQAGLKLLHASQEIALLRQNNDLQAQCLNALAAIHAGMGNSDEALDTWQQALRLSPGIAIDWGNYTELLIKNHHEEEAIAILKSALEKLPDDPGLWASLGQSCLTLNQVDEAASAFQQCLDLTPENTSARLGLGRCHLVQGRPDLAAKAAQDAISQDPQLVDAWLLQAKCHIKKNRYDLAIQDCEAALKVDPTNGPVWHEMGNACLLNRAFDQSISAYQKTLEYMPENGWALSSMAVAYEKLGNFNDAARVYQQSLPLFEKKTDQAAIYQNLVKTFTRLKDPGMAAEAAKQAELLLNESQPEGMEADPPGIPPTEPTPIDPPPSPVELSVVSEEEPDVHLDIRTASEWNEHGNAHLKAGRFDEAIAAYTKAIELAADLHWPYIQNLAIANYQLGKVRRNSSASLDEGKNEEDTDLTTMLDGFSKLVVPPIQQDEQAPEGLELSAGSIGALAEYPQDGQLEASIPVNDQSVSSPESSPTQSDGSLEPTISTGKKAVIEPSGTTTAPAEIEPESAAGWNELGNSYAWKQMYDEAISAYKRAIDLEPKYGSSYCNLGILYQQLGKHQIAVQLYKMSLELLADPQERAMSWYRLGDAYRRLKDHAHATEAYKKAEELVPATSLLM